MGGFLPLCKDAVGVFYRPADCATGYSWWGSYPSAEMESVYTSEPAYWATGLLCVCGGVLSLYRDAVGVYYRPSLLGYKTLVCVCVWGVLPLCRDAVGVFYRPSLLGHWTQTVYSTDPVDWAGNSLVSLKQIIISASSRGDNYELAVKCVL